MPVSRAAPQHTTQDRWLSPAGGSQLCTLCLQAQGIATTARNLPWVRRDLGAQGMLQ